MHPEFIQAELRSRGVKPIRLAERLDVHPSAVSDVINGHSRSRRIAVAISGAIGKPLEQIWTQGEYDRPRKRRRVTKRKAA